MYTEGKNCYYVPSTANSSDAFVISIGGIPLMSGPTFPYKEDEPHRGLRSFSFSPSFETCVSKRMLWKFVYTESGFKLKNLDEGLYLTAELELMDRHDEKTMLKMDDTGTEFFFSDEGWIAFKFGDNMTGFLSSKGSLYSSLIFPSATTSSMVFQSDVLLFAVVMSEEDKNCIITYNNDPEGEVTLETEFGVIKSGDAVPAGTHVKVKTSVPANRFFRGYYVDGFYYPSCDSFCVYRNCEVKVLISGSDSGHYISFESDVHDLPTRLDCWLHHLPKEIWLERMIFGGDITAGSVTSIAVQQHAHKKIAKIIEFHSKNDPVITIGNHEFEYDFRWEGRTVPEIYPDTVQYGPFEFDDYCVYNFGASEFDNDDFQSNFPEEQIEVMSNWLRHAPKDKPIFLNSHYPLHVTKYRPHPKNADKMIDVLNNYPNVIFLWGHNHGQWTDDGYGRILKPGSNITYNYTESLVKQISFTYCSHGAMYDAARTVAPYYGLIARIADGGRSVDLSYYSMSGIAQPYKGGKGDTVYTINF